MNQRNIIIRHKGLTEYEPVWHAMQDFTASRIDATRDELWVTQHHPVYTQGLNGKKEHLLDPGGIPVVQVDRGGQVTYHGPGQLVVYPLLDIARRKLGVRQLVTAIENAVIALLSGFDLHAYARKDAPGVYLKIDSQDAKIASLGLRIKKGKSYHGVSLNVDMDLEPFSRINPCGFKDLAVTQLTDLLPGVAIDVITDQLIMALIAELGYQEIVNQ